MKIKDWLVVNEIENVYNHISNTHGTVRILFEFFTFPFIVAFYRDSLDDYKLSANIRLLWLRINYKGNGYKIDSNSYFAKNMRYKTFGNWMFEIRKWY